MPSELQLLSTDDLVELFGVSKVTLWKWVRTGHFPQPIKMANSRLNRWRPAEINEYIEARAAARDAQSAEAAAS